MAAPVTVPYAKGYAGVTYRTQLGLHRSSEAAVAADPGAPLWDLYVGPLPFLLASAEDRPYLRESVPARRDRLDTTREAGEASLDSALWIRSWTSWHLGAGQNEAEPLETDPEIARFRYARSAGLDPWTDGQIGLLHSVTSSRGDVRFLTSAPGKGVVAATNAGVRLISGASDVSLSTKVCSRITVNGLHWIGIQSSDATVVWGELKTTTPASGAVGGITGATTLHWSKDRLWVGAGSKLHQVTDLVAGTTNVVHTFLTGSIVAIAGSSGGLYVMVDDGLTRIFVIDATSDGTLNAPREVAVLPRGESGRLLYPYLGRFLMIGSTQGVRMADAASTDSLPVGPLIIPITGGPSDVTADGNFIWVTAGTEGIDEHGDGSVLRPGLYRIDVSRVVVAGVGYGDSAASRFAYATDLYAPTTGLAASVTSYGGLVYFTAGPTGPGLTLWAQASTYLASGWFDTGMVGFGTAEMKAWQSLTATVAGKGLVGFWADSGAGFAPVTQTLTASPFAGQVSLDPLVHPPSAGLALRVVLAGDTLNQLAVQALGLRAMGSPKRTRYVQLPLLAFDFEADRNNTPVGYDGFAYDRVKDLEALEEAGALVSVSDARTGESVTGLIEKIRFTGVTPPDRGRGNWGGTLQVTMLVT